MVKWLLKLMYVEDKLGFWFLLILFQMFIVRFIRPRKDKRKKGSSHNKAGVFINVRVARRIPVISIFLSMSRRWKGVFRLQ